VASNLGSRLSHALALLTLLLACTPGSSARGAQEAPLRSPAHAKIDLVAENNSLEAGRPAWIGILFDLDRGWHIYWINPGDAGDPPRIEWNLPAGFRAGEIRWPVPVRLPTGPLIDYGYEGRVLLAIPLQVPADYQAGTSSTLAADVRYVICRDVCIPAKAHVSLSIPSGDGAPSGLAARRELFRGARERWPKPLPAGWEVKASDDGSRFVLSILTGRREEKASFFPLEADQIDNAAAQTVAPAERGARLTLQKSDPQSKPLSVLKGIVVLSGDRAFEIAAPVQPSLAAPKKP
jgi:DsbC/DsbD-like thiol-disulfide interchange protein